MRSGFVMRNRGTIGGADKDTVCDASSEVDGQQAEMWSFGGVWRGFKKC